MFTTLAQNLRTIADNGLYRSRRGIETPQSSVLQVDGRNVLNFCSNDYLGLANHPEVLAAFKAGADRYGVGSGSAHLVCGHSSAHQQLEEALADFTGRDRALLFSTGYMANLGAISALVGPGDIVLEDRSNHASLLDGGLLSRAKFKRYRHADSDSLDALLAQTAANNKLIVTDGVFSMDGDIAPLTELSRLARTYEGVLMVDDAHGLGVLGKNGTGSVGHFRLTQEQAPILVGTLGKAFGTFGAFVAGSDILIETLIQKARTYLFTTALPPAVAEATQASLRLIISETWRREKLQILIRRFRHGAEQLGLPLLDSPTPIQPILIGDNRRSLTASQMLLERGLLVSAIRPPTVPDGQARLRVTLCATHEEAQVDRLLDALNSVCQ